MPSYKLIWEETDAQFLDALLLATGGEGSSTLQDVLLMADAIEGTVFNLKETEQALEKLIAVNFVHVLKNKLSLPPVFQEVYARLEESTVEQGQWLQLLQAQELTEQGIDSARNALKKYKLKNHYQQYQEQFGGNLEI